jgi:hypothetical protein
MKLTTIEYKTSEKTNIVFYTSLCFIIPHRRFNVNIFAKSLCPILTAAEGFVLGMAAKMFIIAGPVLTYGITAATLYGVIYWIMQMI